MPDFPHLKLPFKVDGVIKPSNRRFGTEPNERTVGNRVNRQQHGQYLGASANKLLERWKDLKAKKQKEGLDLPNSDDIPVFLKIDTSVFNIDSLTNWGIEIISEEQEGYIIGASLDGLQSFQENINQFLNEDGRYRDKAAQIWEFVTDDNWRVEQLLKGDLGSIWGNLENETVYTVELGVSCYVANKKNYPNRTDFDSEDRYIRKVEEYNEHERSLQIARGDKQILRENEVEGYVQLYGGTMQDMWDNETDAIFFKLSINGIGLRDIVFTYQYLYEVKLSVTYNIETAEGILDDDYQVNIIAPIATAPKVCVIDSGIQEGHRLLSLAIDSANSRSYVEGDASTADHVRQSGHGTKVAGAVLYPYQIPKNGDYQLESFIQNARILDNRKRISDNRFVPALLQQIVADYPETRIFNLSVTEDSAFMGMHMPSLAASIDKLTHEKDILFIVAAGNLYHSSVVPNNPGIIEHFAAGKTYPDYLDENTSGISNPGVSYFAITVGSISMASYEDDDYKSMAGTNYVSPFSRTGLGLWGNIKPDVVEFGGDLAKNKNSDELKIEELLCPELVSSTIHGASAVGRDETGTSYSAPKVSFIVSRLQTEHPNESAQMYRALIIQSARLPNHCFDNPTLNDIRRYGYGVPDLSRALNNSANRVTFIQNGTIRVKNADIYRLNIPVELRGEGRDFRVLVEVTLSFTTKTRLTRKGAHSYLSNWLEWQSSKYNESFTSFRNRTIEYLELDDQVIEAGGIEQGLNSIRWCLRENPAFTNNGINRNNSTVQKSWAIIEPHQFAEEFSIAVIGHAGWDKNPEHDIPYALCVSFEAVGQELRVYNLMAEAQIETVIEQEVEV